MLPEQNLRCVRTLQQCKAKIKNLEDEFKKIKDHNNKSGNDRITFLYFDDINEVLGCKPGDFCDKATYMAYTAGC